METAEPTAARQREVTISGWTATMTPSASPTMITVAQYQRKILRKRLRILNPLRLRRTGVNVSHSANSFDALVASVLISKLLAQLADVHVDAAIVGEELASQHVFGDLLAGHDLSGRAQKQFKHCELDRGQLDGLPMTCDGAGRGIEFDVTYVHSVSRRSTGRI